MGAEGASADAERASADVAALRATAARLHSAALHLLRRVRREDPAMGLPPARASALSVLVFGGARSLGELAAAEQVRPPTMSRIVAGLAAAGLVTREPDPHDRRTARLVASPRGREILEAGRDRRVRLLEELVGRLEPEECALLEEAAALMERLAAEA